MGNVSELSEMEERAKRLLGLLDGVHLSALDFDNRQHLQVIGLCLDMAIDRTEKLKRAYDCHGLPATFSLFRETNR